LTGKTFSWLLWSTTFVKFLLGVHRRQFEPYMDYDEFGNQHHNLKVGQQNFDILVQYKQALNQQNKSTRYLDEVIKLVQTAQCMKQTTSAITQN